MIYTNKKERFNADHYFCLVDEYDGKDKICYADSLDDIREEAFKYDSECDSECTLYCYKYKVITLDNGKKKGVPVACYNPFIQFLIETYDYED